MLTPIHKGPVQDAIAEVNRVINGDTRVDKYNDGHIEAIDYILDHKMNFCIGNVIKYCTRYGSKRGEKTGNVQDLYKSIHYLLLEAANATRQGNVPKNERDGILPPHMRETIVKPNPFVKEPSVRRSPFPTSIHKTGIPTDSITIGSFEMEENSNTDTPTPVVNCFEDLTNPTHLKDINPDAYIDESEVNAETT